jgi:hypothetical protein
LETTVKVMKRKFHLRWPSFSLAIVWAVCSSLILGIQSSAQSQEPNSSPYGIEADNVAKKVKGYFQGRWRNDPYFDRDLKYRVDIQANGQVIAITGIGESSQIYLSKTGFLKTGEIITGVNERGYVVWFTLAVGGVVRSSLSPE